MKSIPRTVWWFSSQQWDDFSYYFMALSQEQQRKSSPRTHRSADLLVWITAVSSSVRFPTVYGIYKLALYTFCSFPFATIYLLNKHYNKGIEHLWLTDILISAETIMSLNSRRTETCFSFFSSLAFYSFLPFLFSFLFSVFFSLSFPPSFLLFLIPPFLPHHPLIFFFCFPLK